MGAVRPAKGLRGLSMMRLKLWVPVIGWMAVMIALSSIPGKELPEVVLPNIDKIAHFIEYAILGFLLARAIFKSGFKSGSLAVFIIAVAIAVVFAAFDEWHQSFVPGRNTDMIDFMFDMFGSLTGIFIYRRV